jgi:hypothetical protein
MLSIQSGFATPTSLRLYWGDGTGWNLHLSKRVASVDTDIFTFKDTGVLSATTGFQIGGAATANQALIGNGTNFVSTALSLASAQFANQGTTVTVLHGNAAGNPSFAAVSLTADVTGVLPLANQAAPTGTGFYHLTAGASDAAAKLVNLTASTDVAANQGTTTTVLHGNAAGQASFAAVSLTTDVSGILPTANGGTNQNSTATFPTSGVVVTEAASETLTNKTISSASNTLSVGTAAVPAAKGTANQVLAMDGAGTNLTFATIASGPTISKVDSIGLVANVGATTIVAALGHTYLVNVYAVITAAGVSGSTSVTISYTDSTGAQIQSSNTMANVTIGAKALLTATIFAANATNINYSTSGTNGDTYDLHIRVTDLS